LRNATEKGRLGIYQLLISNGANTDLKDSEKTALHYAAEKGKLGIRQLLAHARNKGLLIKGMM